MNKILYSLDKWLWRRKYHNPLVRYMLRAQIVFALLALIIGSICLLWTKHIFFFAVGAAIFANVFWSIAAQMNGLSLPKYSRALLFPLLLLTGLRLILTAVVIYIAFVIFDASALAIVFGVTASMTLALGTFALYGHKQ